MNPKTDIKNLTWFETCFSVLQLNCTTEMVNSVNMWIKSVYAMFK